MGVKKCFKCLTEKELGQFYKHSEMADGHLNKCKDCTKSDSHAVRAARLDYYQEYDRKRASLPKRVQKRMEIAERWKNDPKLKERRNKLSADWRENNKIKRAAHILVGNAIAKGKLIKQPCEVCGELKVDAHHDDYTKPLDVRWLCKTHHAEHHKLEREKERVK